MLSANLLLQLLRLQRNVLFPRRLLLPVMAHPVLPTLARSHVASRKSQGCNFCVGNFYSGRSIFRQQAYEAVRETGAAATIENVAFNLGAIFPRHRNIAAIIERLL